MAATARLIAVDFLESTFEPHRSYLAQIKVSVKIRQT